MSGRSLVLGAFGASLCLAGCLSRGFVVSPPGQRYEPTVDEPFRAGVLTARLREVRISAAGQALEVSLDLSAGEAAFIQRVAVAPAEAPPCSAGWPAQTLKLDGQSRWDRPLGVKGGHSLVLELVGGGKLLERADAVIDLALAGGSSEACLRLPLGEPDPTIGTGPRLQPFLRWTAGGALRTSAPLARVPSGLIEDELRVGVWLGPLLLGAELGWIWTQGCVGDGGGSCPDVPGFEFPLWLVAEAIPLRSAAHGLGVELGWGLVYGPTRTTDWWLQGPRVALHLLELSPPAWPPRLQTRARGLELSIAYQRALVGPVPPAFIIGVGVVAF